MMGAEKTLPVSVLFVEDDADIREQMAQALNRVVEQVYMAHNGLEGFRAFQDNRPDIVVTDIKMPGMDGIELSRLIKESDPSAKIIVMSAHDDAELLKDLIDIGVDAFAMKPVIGNKFFLALERCAGQLDKQSLLPLPKPRQVAGQTGVQKESGETGDDLNLTERLAKVEKELRQKNLELEQFLYTVSHELRGPLVTIKSFLGFLEHDIVDKAEERIGADLDFIHSAADRMETLLNELLEVSRVGRSMNPYEGMIYETIVADSLETLDFNPNDIEIVYKTDGHEYLLCGDRKHMLQIWHCLLDNAVKFLGEQPVPLVEVGVASLNGETVFSVSDNGIGIDPEYHEKVFGIFEKLDRNSSGVGMGLAIVSRIVEQYQGRIWVESEGGGGGSRFCFTLPAAVQVV